ncbi:MAG: transglutaminase [Bacillota bacterium]|nr:transglutaminase [Bacillota bacterium]
MRLRVKNTKKFIRFIVFFVLISAAVLFKLLTSNKLVKIVTAEAGIKNLETSQFIKKNSTTGAFVTDLSSINMNAPGVYEIKIKIGEKVYSSKLKIEDTKPPIAKSANQEIWLKDTIQAKNFISDFEDSTDVKIYYKTQPDFNKIGDQKVYIILEDTSGNKAELVSMLKVKEDKESPVIEGAKDQTFFIDDKISYKKGVTVTDNRDKDIKLNVDSSAVNIKKQGSYKVIYKAADSSGNTAEKIVTIKIVIKPLNYVSREDLDLLADKVLSEIIKNGMSKRDKAKAIYYWVRGHISYINYSDKSDWVRAAYQGIKNGKGDCFNYFAVSQELLTRAGIENMEIIKIGGHHYWSLVNCGNGWYHFDTTPRVSGGVFFMLTDAQLTDYSRKNGNSHVWDRSKYPATPLK